MKPLEKLNLGTLVGTISEDIVRINLELYQLKINELVDAVNQGKEQPEEAEEVPEVIVEGVLKMRKSTKLNNVIVIENNIGEGRFLTKKEAEKLLSEITRLVESMD